MTSWQQPFPGQGVPPPAGFQIPFPQPPGYAQPGVPQPGYPQPGYPQSGYPQPGYPQSGYPGAPYPEFAPQPGLQMASSGYENADYGGNDFTEKAVRRGFIRKVYGILACQLLLTLSIIAFFMFHEPTRLFVRSHMYMYYIGLVATIAIMLVLACCGDIRRRSPANFILLGLFTAVEGFMMGCISAVFAANEVMMGVGITAVICLALTLFAFQTKWDFTVLRGALFVGVIILFVFGIVAIFIQVKIVSLVYSCVGALLFSVYLIYDTQLMMGGSHKYSIHPEEYVFAALNLYIDIINIFIMIMGIIGNSRD